MSYFSNQSNSRFLANSSGNNSSAASTTSNTTSSSLPSNNDSAATKPRQPSSKLFSTSIYSAQPLKGHFITPSGVHPLKNTWIFWFRQQRTPGNKIVSYEEGIKKISAFASVESFWTLWTHLVPPSALLPTTDYLLFHTGIRRPIWEDPLNINGGKWIIRLKKGVADRLWENLVLAVVGDQFDECRQPEDGNPATDGESSGEPNENDSVWPEICGCTISVRQSEDIVSLWNRVDADKKVRERIRDTIRKVLDLPASTIMEYKSNNDSMHDRSSFRNSAIDRTPLP
ncbi:hypothetical protein CCMSSC00406_0004848 [Pleurotus cornucopiae]|uniref:Uncharacterized protein n=1 Tax=Pleurotus cornucopiae TaxID=5321 RepID=A0ACB7J117_PLECO|nr:hypothetical protein CCMSSC00406_0004848 [Pleurotus cornucopiae]